MTGSYRADSVEIWSFCCPDCPLSSLPLLRFSSPCSAPPSEIDSDRGDGLELLPTKEIAAGSRETRDEEGLALNRFVRAHGDKSCVRLAFRRWTERPARLLLLQSAAQRK